VKPEILEQKIIKRCISKVGGDVKITMKFLKEECTAAYTGTNRGVIEILRRVIRADILKEFDKRKYWLISSISIRYICLRVDTLYLLMFILFRVQPSMLRRKKESRKGRDFVSHTHVLKRRRSWQKWRLLWSTNSHCWSHSCRSWRYVCTCTLKGIVYDKYFITTQTRVQDQESTLSSSTLQSYELNSFLYDVIKNIEKLPTYEVKHCDSLICELICELDLW